MLDSILPVSVAAALCELGKHRLPRFKRERSMHRRVHSRGNQTRSWGTPNRTPGTICAKHRARGCWVLDVGSNRFSLAARVRDVQPEIRSVEKFISALLTARKLNICHIGFLHHAWNARRETNRAQCKHTWPASIFVTDFSLYVSRVVAGDKYTSEAGESDASETDDLCHPLKSIAGRTERKRESIVRTFRETSEIEWQI